MKVDTENLNIRFAGSETIRVRIYAIGTTHSVTYDLAGIAKLLLEHETISLDHSVPKPKTLALSLGFTSRTGGTYKIDITGSRGDSWRHTVKQVEGQDNVLLAFGLEGDPGEDL